jgi:F0F1-type ATP synthase assembly protein I
MTPSEPDHRGVLRNLLIVVVGQVGCIALVVILITVRVGMWLDAYYQTRPLYTLVLLFAGIPLSIWLMLIVARRTLARLTHAGKSEQGEKL